MDLRLFSMPSHGLLPVGTRPAMFLTVHCDALVSVGNSSHASGTDTPNPGRERADQALTVVAPKPLRR